MSSKLEEAIKKAYLAGYTSHSTKQNVDGSITKRTWDNTSEIEKSKQQIKSLFLSIVEENEEWIRVHTVSNNDVLAVKSDKLRTKIKEL